MATSRSYPTWLGWLTVVGGVVGLVAGFTYAFGGANSTSKLLFAISAGVFSLVVLYVGVLLLRRSSTVVALAETRPEAWRTPSHRVGDLL